MSANTAQVECAGYYPACTVCWYKKYENALHYTTAGGNPSLMARATCRRLSNAKRKCRGRPVSRYSNNMSPASLVSTTVTGPSNVEPDFYDRKFSDRPPKLTKTKHQTQPLGENKVDVLSTFSKLVSKMQREVTNKPPEIKWKSQLLERRRTWY